MSGLFLLGLARSARAQPCPERVPWGGLGQSGRNFMRPGPLVLTALAIATPFGFAPTGLDQKLRVFSQRHLGGRPNLEPVSVATPYVLAGGLLITYGLSQALDWCPAEHAVLPVLQAGMITFTVVSAVKLGVGRRFPNGESDPSAPDRLQHPERARDFAPFKRGFGAWPSGHTALMFSAAAAFRAANPNLGWPAFLGYPLALGVASGMWLGDHHYASDIVAGALFGQAVGDSIGQSFAGEPAGLGSLTLLPTPRSGFEVLWAGLW